MITLLELIIGVAVVIESLCMLPFNKLKTRKAILLEKDIAIQVENNVTEKISPKEKVIKLINEYWNPMIVVDVCNPKDGIQVTFLSTRRPSHGWRLLSENTIDVSPLVDALVEYSGINKASDSCITNTVDIIMDVILDCRTKINFDLNRYFNMPFDKDTTNIIGADFRYAIERYDATHVVSLKQYFIGRLLEINDPIKLGIRYQAWKGECKIESGDIG